MAGQFQTFQELLDIAESAAPGAGRFAGRLTDQTSRGYEANRIVRSLMDRVDANAPDGMSGFRRALKSATRPDLRSASIDTIAERSSVANELLRAAPYVVAQTPEEIRAAKQMAVRARAIPVYNRQSEDVQNILLEMANAKPFGLRPRDILTARSISRAPEDVRKISLALIKEKLLPRETVQSVLAEPAVVREIALTFIADGMPAGEALNAARLLA